MITFLARHRRVCLTCIVVTALMGTTVSPSPREECVHGGLGPCDLLKIADIALIADVLHAGQPSLRIDENNARLIPQRVILKVIERFKGVGGDQSEIEANIAIRGAETVFLEQGRRYLIYARMREDGTWDTACSGTVLIEQAAPHLESLRPCRVPLSRMRAVPQPELTDADTYDVYSAVVAQLAEKGAVPVLIGDLSLARPDACVARVDPALSGWKQASDDHFQRSGSRLRLLARLQLRTDQYRILSSSDLRRLAQTRGRAVGYVMLSAVGFDSSRTRAVVQRDYGCVGGDPCGRGDTLLLEKQRDGRWQIVTPPGVQVCSWIS